MPTYDVGPTYYARAIGVAAGVAIGGGALWGAIDLVLGMIPYLSWLINVGIGYTAGELISLSVNRKRATGLASIAGATVVVAFFISSSISYVASFPWGLAIIFISVVLAVQRVRR